MSTLIQTPPEVYTSSVGSSYKPEIIRLSDGSYLVAYMQYDVDGSGWGVFTQTFDAFGVQVGGPVQVNTFTTGTQYEPTIALLSSGRYVITWTSSDQDGSQGGIYARTFNAAGVALTGEVQVNTTVTGNQYYSAITALADGGYVITWGSNASGSDADVYFQRYDASGAAVGSETLVNTTTANDQGEPSVTALADGGFVITWESFEGGSIGLAQQIFGQRYDAAGAPVGSEITVTSGATNTMRGTPVVEALPDGGYIVAWTEAPQGTTSNANILAQRFDSSGAKVGGVVLVNATGPYTAHPEIKALADGSYLIAWSKDTGIVYQRFDSSGAKVGGENLLAGLSLSNPGLAAAPDGSYLLSWSDQSSGTAYLYKAMFVNATSGSGGADALAGTSGAEFILGLGGNDTIQGDSGADRLYGGTENDQLIGGHDGDYLYGEDGTDTLWGETGNDQLAGGAGNDLLFGQDGADTLWGETGDDSLYGGDGADVVFGQDGSNVLDGGNGNDTLYSMGTDAVTGGDGDDALYHSTSGVATLIGGEGNDILTFTILGTGFGENGDDTIIGADYGSGNDRFYGQAGNDVLFGQGGNDTLWGGIDNDRLYGQDQDDILHGESGNDTLSGGNGNDAILGEAGADELSGGAGADYFYYTSRTEPADTISDFSHAEGDRLVFTGSEFYIPAGFTLTAGVGLLQGAGVTPVAQTATFYFDTTTKALWFDPDGTGVGGANVIAFLVNTPTLDTADFLFI